MPNLLSLTSPDWTLNVWSKDITPAQAQLRRTLTARGKAMPCQRLRLNPQFAILCNPLPCFSKNELHFSQPLFFENRSYEFEFLLSELITHAEIINRLNSITDVFHFTGNSLRGHINFGNDIGWFRLGIRYQINNRWHEHYISFEVWPSKLDMSGDLAKIHQMIDAQYPLWRFSFAKKTDQELARSNQPHERFPLLWLAQFTSLRNELVKQVRYISHAPHHRLQAFKRQVRLDHLHGKVSTKLEEKIAQASFQRNHQSRFNTTSHQLSIDTPENRFIKMAVQQCSHELGQFSLRATKHNKNPDRERLSAAFFNELANWKKQLDQLLAQPFFAEIGTFNGQERESLVLHQRMGYAGVYRVWQQLKLYLGVFGQHASISVKSVAELYEVWCLLEIRAILINQLGFSEKQNNQINIKTQIFEKQLIDNNGAAFYLYREDGITLKLAHEPIYSKPIEEKLGQIYSWNNQQKPDILLEAEFPNGEKIIWIFDAKYRVELSDKQSTGMDEAPADAINQMHRYRDALIGLSQNTQGQLEKTRPVIGAYVLYPGWFQQEQAENSDCNPYAKAIEAVGIGAFPALPGQPNHWLVQFLTQHLGLKSTDFKYKIEAPDEHLVQDSARIVPNGMKLARNEELILIAPANLIGSQIEQEEFVNGTAQWYHTPNHKAAERAMMDLGYCAIAIQNGDMTSEIHHFYPIKSRQLITRPNPLTNTATNLGHEHYWIFELGKSVQLDSPLKTSLSRPYKITTKKSLSTVQHWDDLLDRYPFLPAL